jgi:hypothetical protein
VAAAARLAILRQGGKVEVWVEPLRLLPAAAVVVAGEVRVVVLGFTGLAQMELLLLPQITVLVALGPAVLGPTELKVVLLLLGIQAVDMAGVQAMETPALAV